MVDARLPDGSRVNAGPATAIDGPVLTSRQFAAGPYTVPTWSRWARLRETAELLRRRECGAQPARHGRHRSGQDDMLAVLSSFIPVDERVVTIEDAVELRIPQPTWCGWRAGLRPTPRAVARSPPRPRAQRPADAARPDRRRRGPRRGGAGHAHGHDHGPRGVVVRPPCVVARGTRSARVQTMALMGDLDPPYRLVSEQVGECARPDRRSGRLPLWSRRVVEAAAVWGSEGALRLDLPLARWVPLRARPRGPTGRLVRSPEM